MVQNPYGQDDNQTNDVRKLKLQLQAQKQLVTQLQGRIGNQSRKIEELNNKIAELNQVIDKKDEELKKYSQRLEEERHWKEKDNQARAEREEKLKKQIRQLEMELDKEKREQISKPKEVIQTPIRERNSNSINSLVEKVIAYYSKPSSDEFIQAVRKLVNYGVSEGTVSQKILGLLLNTKLPVTVEEISNELDEDNTKIKNDLYMLEKNGLIKKIGQGYVIITSSYVDATDTTTDWDELTADKILDNLKTIVTVSSNRDNIVTAFDKARDTLMEKGVLTPLMRHAISKQIERIKHHPLNIQEIVDTLEEWKTKIN